MATVISKAQCSICDKETRTFNCGGCSLNFCRNDLTLHLEKLNLDFDKIENDHDQFTQKLNEQKDEPKKRPLIQQIDKWEDESINKIKQTAKECRDRLINYTNKFIIKIENKLNSIGEKLKQARQDNEFNEIDLNQFKENLKKLQDELDKLPNVSIEQESTTFINKIFVLISSAQSHTPNININAKWVQNGITVAGGNGLGNELNQLNGPCSVYMDDDQTVYVVDRVNNRILEWKSGAMSGQVVAGGNGAGNRNDQLNFPQDVIIDKQNDSLIICDCGNQRVVRWPRRNGTSGETIISNIDCYGFTMDNDGYLYVSDGSKHQVTRWKMGETNAVVAGGNGKGDYLNQLSIPCYIFVDEDHSVYVSDFGNHRVMKWMEGAKEGIVVAGGQGQGNDLTQLSHPLRVIVDQLGTVYVVDHSNHRVMRWLKGATQGSIVVGEIGQGGQPSQLSGPHDLAFDRENNLYVVDYGNHRVQKFNIEPNSN